MTASADLSVPVVAQSAAALAAPPLFVGEDAAAYDDLRARVAGAMKPGDIIEDIWVQRATPPRCALPRRRSISCACAVCGRR